MNTFILIDLALSHSKFPLPFFLLYFMYANACRVVLGQVEGEGQNDKRDEVVPPERRLLEI